MSISRSDIGRTFFPAHDATASLLLTFGASGVGFVARPIGAMIVGPMGDRIGRKAAMLLSGAAIIGLTAMALVKESAPVRLSSTANGQRHRI